MFTSNFLWKDTNYQKQRQLRSSRLWFSLLTLYGRLHKYINLSDSRLLNLEARSAWERMLWSVPAIFIRTVVWPLCTADVDFLCRCRHAASNRQPRSYNLCSSAQLKRELKEAATKNRSFSKTRHEVLNESGNNKQGDDIIYDNYRPISILSSFIMILEKS